MLTEEFSLLGVDEKRIIKNLIKGVTLNHDAKRLGSDKEGC